MSDGVLGAIQRDFDPLMGSCIGTMMMLYSAGWIRGYVEGSGLSQAELAAVTAANGPYWPFLLFGFGFVVLGAGLVTHLQYRKPEATR